MNKVTAAKLLGGGAFLAFGLAVPFTSVFAEDPTLTDTVNISVSAACTVYGGRTINSSAAPSSVAELGSHSLTITCNDVEGWELYAVGDGDDPSNNNSLYNSSASLSIPTGTAVEGDTSNWSFKFTPTSGTYAPTIDYASDYSSIPKSDTKIAHYTGPTDRLTGSSLTVSYQLYTAAAQQSGMYTGKVKYRVSHPYVPPQDITTIANMQDMTSEVCTNSTVGQTNQLKDTRDNKLYWVAKLADDNCWMTQNLDFDIDSSKTYTSADTNLSSNWTPSISTYETGDDTWEYSYTSPGSYDPGDVCWNGNLNTDWDGTLDTETVACTSSNMNYHIGNYYNWTAAVAMNDSSSYTTDETVVTQSICPAGWTLPLSGYEETGSGSFVNLLDQYDIGGTQTMWGAPLSFVLGGYWFGSSDGVASYGYYWSSVVYASDGAYDLYFFSDGYVDPQNYDGRNYGFSVRCVAAP